MIDISEVSLRNFLGYGDYTTTIDFNKISGICLVEGEVDSIGNIEEGAERRNGAGKSSLVEAIVWCLFGNLTRKENPGDRVINWFNKKNCIVTVKTKDGFEITRTRKYEINGNKSNELLIMKDGEDLTRSTSIPAQKFINEKFNIFYHTCVRMSIFSQFGSGFMELSEPKMRQVMECLLQIDNLNPIARAADKKLQGVKYDLELSDQQLNNIANTISNIESNINDLNDKKDEYESDRNNKINEIRECISDEKNNLISTTNDIKKEISSINDSINEISKIDTDSIMSKWNEYEEKLKAINEEKDNLKIDISELNRNISVMEESISSIDIPDEINIDEIIECNDRKTKLLTKLKKNKELRDKLLLIVDRLNIKINNNIEFINNPPEIGKCDHCLQDVSKEYVNEIVNNRENDNNGFTAKLDEAKLKLSKLDNVIEDIEDTIHELSNVPSIEDAESNNNKRIKAKKKHSDILEKVEEHKYYKENRINELKNLNSIELDKPDIDIDEIYKIINKKTSLEIDLKHKKEQLKDKIKSSQNKITDYKSRLSEVKDSNNPYEDLIFKANNELDEYKEKLKTEEKKIKDKRILKNHITYIKESYRNKKKIKAYRISKLIPEYNKYLEYYLNYFEVADKIQFDEYLTPKMSRWGYETHSGGECKRIDISMMFALNDLNMATHGPQCNFMVLDEVDGRLDPFAIDKLASLLSDDIINRNNGVSNIFVISHRDEMKDRFPHKIRVKNKQERSYIING